MSERSNLGSNFEIRNDIEELPKHFLRELRIFFEDYKKLENKTVDVEEFQNREVAQGLVKQSMVDYENLIKGATKL